MCGIIAAFKTNHEASVNEEVVLQFEDQHSRGVKGFGVVGINPDLSFDLRRSTEGAKFMFDLHSKSWPMMMVHHRFPTSSENWISQTHPILVSNECLKHDYLVIHNGVISLPGELKQEHEGLGFQYTTAYIEYSSFSKLQTPKFNDSEAIAIEVALFIENKSNIIKASGTAAFMALQINKETKKITQLFFGRNDRNPLNMAQTRGYLFLSSEGKGDPIAPNTLFSCKLEGNMKLKKRPIYWKQAAYSYETGYAGATGQQPIGFKDHGTTTAKPPAGKELSVYSHSHVIAKKSETLSEVPSNWLDGNEEITNEQGELDEELGIKEAFEAHNECEALLEEFFDSISDIQQIDTVDINHYMREIRQCLTKGYNAATDFHMGRVMDTQHV